MSAEWCRVCSTRHGPDEHCPGELAATGPERLGWKANVETGSGFDAVAILLAPCGSAWRARVMTCPNIVWLVPGGRSSLKFEAPTPEAAERKAREFVRAHCDERGWTIRPGASSGSTGTRGSGSVPRGRVAPRKFRFLDIRFGVVHPAEAGGLGNLSETGLFILTDAPLARGTRLRISLPIDDGGVLLDGRVVWNRTKHRAGGSPGMGIELTSPPERYVRYVRALD